MDIGEWMREVECDDLCAIEEELSGTMMVVILSVKRAPMKAYAHYCYHIECWDSKERCEDKENWISGQELLSDHLSAEPTPVSHGVVRLIPRSEVASIVTCSYCFKAIEE